MAWRSSTPVIVTCTPLGLYAHRCRMRPPQRAKSAKMRTSVASFWSVLGKCPRVLVPRASSSWIPTPAPSSGAAALGSSGRCARTCQRGNWRPVWLV